MSASIRVTAAQKNAVLEVLAQAASFTDPKAWAEAIALAVITAEDVKTRYCVVTTNPAKETLVFGPYATFSTAEKAVASGYLGTMEGTKGFITPLIPAPKKTTK